MTTEKQKTPNAQFKRESEEHGAKSKERGARSKEMGAKRWELAVREHGVLGSRRVDGPTAEGRR